jgi:hypothetical protein
MVALDLQKKSEKLALNFASLAENGEKNMH